jgi:chain length determinant protein EpsF
MDFSQFMLALRARRNAFFMVLGATVVAALAIALIVPKNYVATTQILIDSRSDQTLSAAERMTPRERTGYLQTQLDLLTSPRVAKRAIRDLKYTQIPGIREQYEREAGGLGTIEDWAVTNLQKKLKADAGASNVITISYGSPDPKFSADVANAFAKAYVDTSLELRTEPSKEAAAWFEDQIKGLRANVSQTQAKLTAYQKAKGITSVDERGDIETARLNEISTQLLQARAATYDAQARYKHAQEFLAPASSSTGSSGANAAAADSLPEVAASVPVQAVKAALIAAETRLEQSAADLGPNHPAYQRNLTEVQGLRAKLASEMKKVVAGLSNTALQSRRREEELKAAYTQQQERMTQMRDARVELAVMSHDVENAQRTYDAALQRYLTSKVEARALTTNIEVLSPAAEPLEPKSPKIGLISGLSLIVGLLLAGGMVFLLESTDRRVRSRADLESRLAVPTLGRLSRWQPASGRLLPAPVRAAHALPHPW